jgi:hypothetical protein
MRKFFAGLFFLIFAHTASAQQSTVSGTISDTLGRKNLSNAVVSLLQKKDSTLYKFGRTDKNGVFSLHNVSPGKYVLLITYPKFADFSDEVEIKNQPQNDLGKIPLTLKSQLLDAVVIKSAGAIRIKGDTTEFVADSFHVKDGATVEELLKKLPGFQVNSKGQVTAQGQKVGKVLVDGEEFFGDDPTMATKNIAAKAVDKVQVFDTKSEQQNITGISSGTEGKTVNIKLKEDMKKGSFGKAEAGSNFKNVTDAKVLYNQFVGKRKFSLYGTKSNTSTGSLSWEDQRSLGMDNDWEYDEVNDSYTFSGNGDDFNNWSLRGLPNAYTAGALYINKWNQERQGINGSYRYNRLTTSNLTTRMVQSITPTNLFNTNSTTATNGLIQQHAGNIKYEWKVDSLTSFKLISALTRKTTKAYSEGLTETDNLNLNKTTTNNSTSDYDKTHLQSDNQLQYKQLFKKKDRILLATLRLGATNDNQDAMIFSKASFFTQSTLDSIKLQDQQKINTGNSLSYGAKVIFSEPLNLKWSLVTEYSYNKNNSTSHKNTFNKDINGKYEALDSVFSNNFDLDVFSHSGSLIAKYVYKKFRFAFGSGISAIRQNLNNLDNGKRTNYNFTNFTPQASFNYRMKPQSFIGLNYRGTTRQPKIDQLQPLRDNNDQLNIFQGNPDLKVGFNHNFSLFYNSYKVLSQRGIWMNASYNIIKNAITQSSNIDASGKRFYTPVNVNGNRNWYFWSQWNKGEGEKKWNSNVQLNGNGGTNITIVNGTQNKNEYYTIALKYGIRYEVTDKYRLYISPEINFNDSKSSLNKNLKTNYIGYGGDAEAYVMFPAKLELSSDINIDLRQNIPGFSGTPNIIVWNANLSRKILKDKSGKITFLVNDILDKNKGFNRNINSDQITEERYQRLSRYFMLKFEWSFNKMPGKK